MIEFTKLNNEKMMINPKYVMVIKELSNKGKKFTSIVMTSGIRCCVKEKYNSVQVSKLVKNTT